MPDLTMDIWLVAHEQFESVFKKLGVEVEGLRGKIGLLAGGFGVLAGGALAESVKQASDYQSMLSHVAANTTMTTAGIKEMDTAIQDMAAHSSAHMEDLAQAWMHVTDLGFTKAADAQKVVQAAMESALSTGGSVIDTANVLANAMHEFGIKATDAGHAMDLLHLASAEGNTTLEQFVDGAGRAIGMAANLGVSLADASAAISALTRHGFDAPTASTQLVGMLEHITNPAKATRDELARLSKVTGINLVYDFSQAGLHAKGLSGVLADVQKATHGNSAEIEKLIPALRGGLGAMTLTGTGAKDYAQILSDLNDTMAGKTNPTAAAYARTQATLSFQIGVLKNNLQEMAIAIGSAVLPVLTKLTAAIVPVVQGIATWIGHHGSLVAGLLAGVAVVGTLIGAILVLGPAIAAIASPIGLIVVAIGAAVAGLTALLSSSSGLRAALVGIWSKIADDAGALWQWLTGIWNGISGDAMLLWENLGSWLSSTWTGIVSAAAPIWNGLVNAFTYVWDTITGDKDAAAAALKKIPAEWRPLIQAIGDVLAGSWFTVKYIWDSIFGRHEDATADLKKIPPEWRPLVQAIGDVFVVLLDGPAYIWNLITAKFDAAKKFLKNVVHDWTALVASIGHVFTEAKKDITNFWNEVSDAANKAWNKTLKPTLAEMKKDWNKFVHDLAPLLGPALATIKAALNAAAAPFKLALGVIIGALSGVWKGFWSGDGKGGAKQLLLDGLGFVATTLKGAAHILEDAVLVVMAIVGHKWGVAWTKIKDMVGTWFGWIRDAMKAKDTILGDAMHTALGIIENVFLNWVGGSKGWGKKIMQNIGDGIKEAAAHVTGAFHTILTWMADHSPLHSPAREGPLSRMPDFVYYADAIRAAIPQVRAASRELLGATGLGGGSLGLNVGASGGLGGAAGTASMGALGGRAAGGPVMNNTININGGTFTDKKGISDLAEKVSEEIMHKVRLQGGLLPQI